MAVYSADTYNAAGGKTLDHVPAWAGVGSYCRTAKWTVDTAPVAADTVNFMIIPGGAVIQDMVLTTDNNLGTTLTFDLGVSGGDVDLFFDGLVLTDTTADIFRLGSVDAQVAKGGHGHYNASDWILMGTVVTAAGGTTDATLTLSVWYTMDRAS